MLNDRLRKSSLPPGYEKMPVPTSAEALKLDHEDSKKSQADRDINKKINAKMTKTNLHFGKDQLSYVSMARETLTQPALGDYSKSGDAGDRALEQRKHNYKVGYAPNRAESNEKYYTKVSNSRLSLLCT